MKLGNISVTYIELMAKAFRHLGGDPKLLFEKYHIDPKVLASPDARISIPRFMRLGHDAIVAIETPWLGLEMGHHMEASHLGLGGLVAMCAKDLTSACIALTRYELLNSYNIRGQSSFYIEDSKGIAQFYSISPYNQYNLFVVDYVLVGWYRLLRLLTGQSGLAVRLEFEFSPPEYHERYIDYVDCEVRFNCSRNAVVIKTDALNSPLPSHCLSTYHGLHRHAERELEKARLGYSFQETVERALGPLLNGNTPSLEEVARRLHMTSWTLRRRLSAEGVTYQQLLNTTRMDLSLSYVKDTKLSLGEIAYLVGFGSAAAFQRAFKRWTGVAPGKYREQLH